MSLFKLIWQALPCLFHDGELDVVPGLIRLRCMKCGRVTDGVEVPTFEEWQEKMSAFMLRPALKPCGVLPFTRRS